MDLLALVMVGAGVGIIVADVVGRIEKSKKKNDPPKVAPQPLPVPPPPPRPPPHQNMYGKSVSFQEHENYTPGPRPGFPVGVPIPSNALKLTSFDVPAPPGGISKLGILTRGAPGKDGILDLFIRPIFPGQDLYEYYVRDKNDFIIKLKQTRWLENGDVVNHIPGKEGAWKVNVFTNYVWA
jgi:hypothetical protein